MAEYAEENSALQQSMKVNAASPSQHSTWHCVHVGCLFWRALCQALSTSTISKRVATSSNMQSFARAVRWFGTDVVATLDAAGLRINELVGELQQGTAALAGSSDANIADIRKQISCVHSGRCVCVSAVVAPSPWRAVGCVRNIGAIQKEVTDLRINVRQVFENALSVSLDESKFEDTLLSDTPAVL